jgi:HlyD family secretion protein
MDQQLAQRSSSDLHSLELDHYIPPPGVWAPSIGYKVLGALVILLAATVVFPYENTIRASGVVRPDGENSLIQSQLSSRVEKVLVKPNQKVRSGEPMILLERSSLLDKQRQLLLEHSQLRLRIQAAQHQHREALAQIEAARRSTSAVLESSTGDIDKSQAALALATNELRRFEELSKVGAVPELLAREKSTRHLIAVRELRQSQLAVTRQRAEAQSEIARFRQASSSIQSVLADLLSQSAALTQQLEEVRRNLRGTIVRAPFDGSVLSLSVKHPTEVVAPGTVLGSIAPLHAPPQVQVRVRSQDVSQVRPGRRAYLRVAGCPPSDFGLLPARVESVSADAAKATGDQPSNDSHYLVTINPDSGFLRKGDKRCQLRYGMSLQADILEARTSFMGFLVRKLRLFSSV